MGWVILRRSVRDGPDRRPARPIRASARKAVIATVNPVACSLQGPRLQTTSSGGIRPHRLEPLKGNYMIEARDLTKRYGDKLAVDHLSFTVEPGRVTGFLGPNGAGKSTTMRLILALDPPLAGIATIGGRRYVDLAQPLRIVGALLEARAMHPGRSAYD